MEYHLRDVAVRAPNTIPARQTELLSATQLRASIHVLPTAAMLIEQNSAGSLVITATNGTLAQFVGAPLPAAPLPELPVEFFLPDRRTPIPACMLPGPRAIHRGETVRDIEVHALRRDGEWRAALMSASPVSFGGRVAGAAVTLQDITSLRDSDERRNQFLAVLGHELRNPLMPISNSLAILDLTPADSPPARHALGVIGRQVAQLNRLVDDLLDVVRIARGKVRLRRELIDLRSLIARAAEDHRDLFESAGVLLDVRLPADPLLVMADPARLTQVVGNLLNNAVKFTTRGHCVWLRAEPKGTDVTLVVADEGIGIRREALPHVFEAFVQADDSITRSVGGLGLGLPLVKAIVEMHDGRVSAASEGPGRGTTMSVVLPMAGPIASDQGPREATRI